MGRAGDGDGPAALTILLAGRLAGSQGEQFVVQCAQANRTLGRQNRLRLHSERAASPTPTTRRTARLKRCRLQSTNVLNKARRGGDGAGEKQR